MNQHPMIHLSTFGGSDIGCRVAAKALEIYEREKPWINAAKIGKKLLTGIADLIKPNSAIRHVAGKGLLLSLDVGSPEKASRFCRNAAKNGLLLAPGCIARNTVLLRPSLLISAQEADEILAAVASASLL
jgi:acetylornithine/succinyldiaminopimelate/putrescine aminotransferase